MDHPLQIALRRHRSGQLQEAAGLYRAILARSPDDPEALHLLGLVAHRLGQHADAARLIAHAIVIRPAAAYYANLAEGWRALGRLDRAIECGRAALRLRPDYPEAIHNLGLIVQQQGDLVGAIDTFRRALELRPDFAAAQNSLGNALRCRGAEDAAIEHFRRAVALDHRLAEAHSNLGQLLAEKGQLDEALEHCGRVVQLRPEFAEAQSNLVNVLRDLGRLDEARRHYVEALRLVPRIGMISNNMAQLLQEEGRLDEATSWYEQALSLDPGSPLIRCNAASALAEKDRHDDAAAHYQAALRLDPRCAEAHAGLVALRHEQGRGAEAKAHYAAALEIRPDSAAAHCGLGVVLEELGDLEGAEDRFRATSHHNPRHAGAVSHLATMLRGKLPEVDLSDLRRMLAEPDQREGRRAALHFGLAQALDARGEYAEAAAHLREANALALDGWRRRGEAYDPVQHTEFSAAMRAACDPSFFERVRGLGLDAERPVFVFGLPRSGTTLIEQILASHSQVFGAGETRLALDHFEALPAAMARPDPPMASLPSLDRDDIAVVGRLYVDRLRDLDAAAIRVVDKMPDNYVYLGLLAALFPRAKYIHCRRDLRDVAVSCWMTNFRRIR